MALANKLGGLLKKATSSNPSIYQAIRCMSSKLFVGGLSYSTDDHSLRDEFANYGQIIEARVIVDRESGRSRGFGFVTYSSSEEASAALTAMDGKDLHGRTIRVNHATERTGGFRGGGGGGFGSGGGGYGGGGGYVGGGGGYGGGYGGGGGGGYGGGNYGNRGGGGYGGGVSGGAGGNFAAGGSDSFGTSFGGDSGFGAASGSTGGDRFSGPSFSGNKNDEIMDDMFKDDEPDNYADKRA